MTYNQHHFTTMNIIKKKRLLRKIYDDLEWERAFLFEIGYPTKQSQQNLKSLESFNWLLFNFHLFLL